MRAFESDYDTLKHMLNKILSSFSTNTLRENTETKEDFACFVELRKELTTVYKNGQQLLKQIKQHRSTGCCRL